MSLTDLSVVKFIEALGSPSPTPGGGSASALAGALGASLLAMVAAMPSRRAPSEEDVARLRAAGARSGDAGVRLTSLVDRDSAAYDEVMAAYKLPKSSDEEKRERAARIQEALTGATSAPLDVMRTAAEALEMAVVVAEFGNRNASSDVGVAVALLGAAVEGAALNVEINLAGLTDQALGDAVRTEAARLRDESRSAIGAARRYLDGA